METNREAPDVHVLACVKCPRVSGASARGWKAYRTDDPLENKPPMIAFYCPECDRADAKRDS